MPTENTQEQHVTISRLVAGGDGESRFKDHAIDYDTALGPLRQTAAIPTTSICFHWLPTDFASDFRAMIRPCLIMVIGGAASVEAGSGEARVFHPGDLLEVTDCNDYGHDVRAMEGQPFRAAVINLDAGSGLGKAPARQPSAQSLPFLRNVTGDDGRSHFEDGALPYFTGDGGSLITGEIAIARYQFVLALGDLSFDFHNAPQRQIVLPLTGGIQGENGDGSRRQVAPGGVYFGEDTTGQGHITRALDGAVRFSIFAHLA